MDKLIIDYRDKSSHQESNNILSTFLRKLLTSVQGCREKYNLRMALLEAPIPSATSSGSIICYVGAKS